jgi:hypothetical protein
MYTFTCLLGLRQCVEAVDSSNILEVVFANFTDLKFVPANSGLVMSDTYHRSLSIDIFLPPINTNLNSEFSNLIYAAGNYTLLYNILSTYDWSSMYETTSVDTAVASLSGAMEQAIPCGYSRKVKFPPWFSHTLRYYIKQKKKKKKKKNTVALSPRANYTD